MEAAQANQAEAKAKAKVLTAESGIQKAEADEEKAQADVGAYQARLEVARAAAGHVQALLGYTQMKAPYAGILTRFQISPGDYLTAEPAKSHITIARLDPIRVVLPLPEADAGLVTVG